MAFFRVASTRLFAREKCNTRAYTKFWEGLTGTCPFFRVSNLRALHISFVLSGYPDGVTIVGLLRKCAQNIPLLEQLYIQTKFLSIPNTETERTELATISAFIGFDVSRNTVHGVKMGFGFVMVEAHRSQLYECKIAWPNTSVREVGAL
jgi:hypothetical protein